MTVAADSNPAPVDSTRYFFGKPGLPAMRLRGRRHPRADAGCVARDPRLPRVGGALEPRLVFNGVPDRRNLGQGHPDCRSLGQGHPDCRSLGRCCPEPQGLPCQDPGQARNKAAAPVAAWAAAQRMPRPPTRCPADIRNCPRRRREPSAPDKPSAAAACAPVPRTFRPRARCPADTRNCPPRRRGPSVAGNPPAAAAWCRPATCRRPALCTYSHWSRSRGSLQRR